MQYQSLLVMMERAWKPEVEVSPTCPRCGSANTKFCYYNNYSLTQPRYFCKGCRRYWTKGGSLRNIPVGGGCRKNRRGKSIRLSTDFMSSRSTGFQGTSSHLQPGLSHGSSSSSMTPPDIDLALVYANFLNPQPPGSNDGSGSETGQPSSSNSGLILHHPCTSSGMSDAPDSGVGLLEAGNGLFGWESLSDLFADTHLNKDRNHITPTPTFDHSTMVDSLQQCGNEDMNYYILSHLPNEDIVSRETTASWSSTHHLLVDDHCMQAPEQPVHGPDHQVQAEDPNLSTGIGYRELDFPGEDTLPRK